MVKWAFLAVLVFVGALAWQVGSRLSSDAVSMGLGVMFGVLAGIPTAILVMASERNRGRQQDRQPERPQQSGPPVIVITSGPAQALPHDVRHHVVMPSQAGNFYEVEPEHSRDIVRRRG